MGDRQVGGLADQVAGEEQPRPDLALLEESHELAPLERRVGPHRDREAEPAGLLRGVASGSTKYSSRSAAPRDSLRQLRPTRLDEAREPIELREPDRRLRGR